MTDPRTPRVVVGRALRRASSRLDIAQSRLLGTATLAERSARQERAALAAERSELKAERKKLDKELAKLHKQQDKLRERVTRHGARTHRLGELYERLREIDEVVPPPESKHGGLPPTHHIRHVENAALRYAAESQAFDALVDGAAVDVAIIRAVKALLAGNDGANRARSIAQALQERPDLALVGDVAGGCVAATDNVREWAWELFNKHPVADVLRLAPSDYFHTGFIIDPDTTRQTLTATLAGELTVEVGAEDWLSIAKFALAAGAIDEAAGALARAADSGDVTPDFEPRRAWLAEWIERRRHAADPVEAPAGTIPFAVIDYKQPDMDLSSRNLGDPVQTLASLGHLARRSGLRFGGDPALAQTLTKLQGRVRPERVIDGDDAELALYCVDRDATNYFALPDRTWMIAFGWYSRRVAGIEYDLPFHPNLRPIFVSFHVNQPAMLTPAMLEYLRAHGPIGCRDWNTVALLTAADVPAFFSGCITTTTDTLFPPDPAARPHGTLYVDTPKTTEEGEEFEQIFYDVRVRSLAENLDDALDMVGRYRDTYEQVVTSRLHCYMPSRSIGANVEFRPGNPADVRFDGLAFVDDAAYDAMRQGFLTKLDVVLGAIAAGKGEDEVYALWRDVCAPDVTAARERLLTVEPIPPVGFDIGEALAKIHSESVTRERIAPAPDGAEIAVELTLDGNFKRQLDIVLHSIVTRCSRPIRAYVLCRDLDASDFERVGARFPTVSFVWLPTDHVDYGPIRGMLFHVTPATMDRLLLPDLLPDLDRIVHFDLDALCLADLAELHDVDFEGLPLAARSSPQHHHRSGFATFIRAASRQSDPARARELIQRTHARHRFDFDAFNAGIMVLNLAAMRADHFGRDFLPYVERFGFNDQEVLNAYAGARRAHLPGDWNRVPRLETLVHPKVVHWAGQQKPWRKAYTHGRDLWRDAEAEFDGSDVSRQP